MTAKPVQISLDTELLRRIDEDPEVKEKGRSAFVRTAIVLYLAARKRRRIDIQIKRAYEGQEEAMLGEIEDLMSEQAWPET